MTYLSYFLTIFGNFTYCSYEARDHLTNVTDRHDIHWHIIVKARELQCTVTKQNIIYHLVLSTNIFHFLKSTSLKILQKLLNA